MTPQRFPPKDAVHLNATMQSLVEGTSGVVGQDFFRVLVRQMARALNWHFGPERTTDSISSMRWRVRHAKP